MKLYEQSPKLRAEILRRGLIRVHTDLLTIHRSIEYWRLYHPEEITTLEKMVIALEDRRFFDHKGYDIRSLFREIIKASLFKRHGGASTIDMQFVRTNTGYKDLTIRRKLYEILLSRLIQYRYNKVTILRSYVHCAYFGSHLIGCEKASMAVYGKSADSLSHEEAAMIASLLVYPRPQTPSDAWNERVSRRARYGMAVYVRHKERVYKL